jgi:outer membrane protein assembly factor BamB
VVGAVNGAVATLGLDGRQIWRSTLGASVVSTVATDRSGGLLVGDATGTLHCLDARTGAQRWERPLVHRVESETMMPGGALIAAPPLVSADGTIYLGGRDGSLTALGPDGAVHWRYETGSDITSTPMEIADGTIIVGLLDWRLLGMSPAGRPGWYIHLSGPVRNSPLRDPDGNLYIPYGRRAALCIQGAGRVIRDHPSVVTNLRAKAPELQGEGILQKTAH